MPEHLAPAKINLSLHVTGQDSKGYHLLDSIVVFAKAGDRLGIEANPSAGEDILFEARGPFAQSLGKPDNNLVVKAANLLAAQLRSQGYDPFPVRIVLEKNLPVASGMGGGSADAAAALHALEELWANDADIELEPLALELGADVPMCLRSGALRAQGTGEKITPLDAANPLHLVLTNPGAAVSTADVFQNLATKSNPPLSNQVFAGFPTLDALKAMRNDLQSPAIRMLPVIGEVLDVLDQNGSRLSRMSGSGASCFGIYPDADAAKFAVKTIRQAHPGWWCVATDTIVS